MSALQHQKIEDLCTDLKLVSIIENYPELAQKAATSDWSHTEFLEAVLKAERVARQSRTQATLTRMAGFPAIKTLAEYDYSFATGTP